ncbi:MICAL-like protein 2 isoform X2 [Boleophthalmus pectinirostris]|uniref:MICAL-like protein 2 isoform X2 n=1 Tax=Boleophthalmus pectinirostris TaxID=150288 RepID=UPI002431AAB2|nr:MICAL-like protein 2 isoform X2 [Boleophthalmus pectinirostris]
MAAVKALQQWCRVQCEGYRDVSITNMTTSFRDGLAFCALIHRHRPDLIDFDALKKENVYDNNKLAFSVAEQELGIPALLDAEDMVALRVPDRLSILTYVSQYYNYFHGRSPIGGMAGVKRPAEGATEQQPAGKKNTPVSAKVFPPTGPAKENLPPSGPRDTHRQVRPNVPAERPPQTGTLSNKCVSCNKHVHLVQRHLVDGKLYHRNCAKTLTGSAFSTDLPKNSSLSRPAPDPDPVKTGLRPVPSWLSHKPSTPSSVSSSTSHPQPAPSAPASSKLASPSILPPRTSAPSTTNISSTSSPPRPADPAPVYSSKFSTPSISPPKTTETSRINISSRSSSPRPTNSALAPSSKFSTPSRSPPRTSEVSKINIPSRSSSPRPTNSALAPLSKFSTPSRSPPRTTEASRINISSKSSSPQPATSTKTTSVFPSRFSPSTPASISKLDPKTESMITTESTAPTPTPRTSIASKNLQAKLKFFQSNDAEGNREEKGAPGRNQPAVVFGGQKEEQTATHSVTVVVQVGEKKNEKDLREAKASAVAIISKKLTEENNNTPAWSTSKTKAVSLHRPSSEAPKKEGEGVRGRVRLRANPALLSDLTTSSSLDPKSTPAERSTPADKSTPSDFRGAPKPRNTSPPPSGPHKESPSDWRTHLKPVSKESTEPSASSSSQSSLKPWTNGSGLSQSTDPTRPGPRGPAPGTSAMPPPHKGFSYVPTQPTAPELSNRRKTRADYIPPDDILKELQHIEDSLNELEKTGVELELKLRTSEENGEDESVMNELMVDWFTLIRNKQVAMRRESELVYIGRTQELEEEQPTVEEELRRLFNKPDHLKTSWERRREEELMKKLVEIVNNRNEIVEGLDEDRLREKEEDEQLSQLMESFNLKKEKKKSFLSRLFGKDK